MRSYIDDDGRTIVEMTAGEAQRLQSDLFAGMTALDNASQLDEYRRLGELAYKLEW